MSRFHTWLMCVGLCIGTTHCAAQSASWIPSSLDNAGRASYESVARQIPNPCPEVSDDPTLGAFLQNGHACHDASILAADLTFYIQQGLERDDALVLTQNAALSLKKPMTFETNGRPRLGEENAPVEIVIFSDFQCPYCAQAAQTMHAIHEARPGAVSIVFKQLPLVSIHPFAAAAALVAVYAQSIGKFWQTHDRLFDAQKQIGSTFLKETLEELGADVDTLFDPVKGQPYAVVVIEDMAEAKEADVAGTPSVFVNGIAIQSGARLDRLLARVDAELSAPASKTDKKRALLSPFPSTQESYRQLDNAGRADLFMMTKSVLCPCPESAHSFFDCATDDSPACPQIPDILSQLITRLLAHTPQPDLVEWLQNEVTTARSTP